MADTNEPTVNSIDSKVEPSPEKFVVFAGKLGSVQDGNGWWSKLAMIKAYAQLGFRVAIWEPSESGFGSLHEINARSNEDRYLETVCELDFDSTRAQVAAVVDRYKPNFSNPDLLRLIFEVEDGNSPKIVADFSDVLTWINELEGRSFSLGDKAFEESATRIAWRPDLLSKYDIVYLPEHEASLKARRILHAISDSPEVETKQPVSKISSASTIISKTETILCNLDEVIRESENTTVPEIASTKAVPSGDVKKARFETAYLDQLAEMAHLEGVQQVQQVIDLVALESPIPAFDKAPLSLGSATDTQSAPSNV